MKSAPLGLAEGSGATFSDALICIETSHRQESEKTASFVAWLGHCFNTSCGKRFACSMQQSMTSAVNRDFRSIGSHCTTLRMQPTPCTQVSGSAVHESSSRVWKQLDAQATLSLNYLHLLACLQKQTQCECGVMKPALSIAFSVADAQEVLSEHKSIDPVTVKVTVGGTRCSVVDLFALLRSLSLEAGQTTANVCRYTV